MYLLSGKAAILSPDELVRILPVDSMSQQSCCQLSTLTVHWQK
jgi:hypothetical protein